jgi:hypothetical protein
MVCWPVANTVSGIFRLGVEGPSGERDLAARARQLELEDFLAARHHDEATLGAGDLDRRIEHHREHFIEHAARPERAQVLEQRRQLAQLGRGGDRAFLHRRRFVVDEEENLGVAGISQLDLVAVAEDLLARHLDAVHVGAEPRLLVADHAVAVLDGDLGVHARDVGAREAQIGLAPAPDGEQRLVDVHDAAAERVGDDETGSGGGLGHEERDYTAERRRSP